MREAKRVHGLRYWAGTGPFVGALLCGVGAGGATVLAGSYHWRVFVPLAFTFVLLLISLIFGARAGIVGTVLAAAIFAAFLFQPVGNLTVGDTSARSNIAWMLLIGVSFAFFFSPPTSGLRRP
ncbi:MAG: hypothetical protein ACM3SW_05585 [Actinomycetota bacterium]